MSSRPLDKPSDVFFGVAEVINAAGFGVTVSNYDDFESMVGDAEVLIEIERTSPGEMNHDGRAVHVLTMTIHAVISRARKFSSLEAANLATAIERLATHNRWGFPGAQCDFPEELRSGPSIFQRGASGYDAWGCTFKQKIALGPERVMPDPFTGRRPPVGDAEPVVWRIDTP